MRRLCNVAAGLVLVAGSATQGEAQNTLAQRVSNARDGIVHLQFAGKPGECGDGRDLIGYRKAVCRGKAPTAYERARVQELRRAAAEQPVCRSSA